MSIKSKSWAIISESVSIKLKSAKT